MSEWMDVDIALASVPVNMLPLIDDTDFKTIEAAVVYNQAGLALFWNFTTTAGVKTVTAIVPTTGGDYDWTDFTTSGMYGIEIPASGGASINNDAEGFGYFTGVATGILPWRGPTIGFRAAAINNLMIDVPLALENLQKIYDGTGYLDPTGPASRSQVSAIGAGGTGGALPYEVIADNQTVAIKGISAVGAQTGTFGNTEAEDGALHTITHAANAFDRVYRVNITGSRTAVEILWKGYLTSSNDTMNLQAYDFIGADWETVKVIAGQNGTVNVVETIPVLTKHTGTGADLGDVLIRLVTSAQTSPVLNTDQLLVNAVANISSAGFDGGAVWYDDVGGTAGQAEGVGFIDRPSSVEADAKAIADSNNLRIIHCLPGSTFVMEESMAGFEILGARFTLTTAGFSLSNALVQGAMVSGIYTGTPNFSFCDIGNITGPAGNMHVCALTGTILADAAGDWFIHHCYSGIAGPTKPVFDFGTDVGVSSNVIFGDYQNGITFNNYNNSGTDLLSLSGTGSVVYGASSSGTVQQRGKWEETNTGGVTINRDDDTQTNIDTLEDTADMQPKLGTPADTSISKDILDLKAVADAIPTTAMRGTDGALTDKEGFSLAATGLDLILSTATGMVAIAKAVWDRVISMANHNIGQSAGKILRQSGDLVQIDGAVSDVSPAVTGFDTNLTEIDGYWQDAVLIFSNGAANAGLGKPVSTFLNTNGAITFDAPDDWPVTPVNGDDFVIYATHVHPVAQIADAVLTGQMTESYAANGVAPTLAQAQFAMHQMLMQFGIAGTSITVRKLDDTSTAFIVTLDDGTTPIDAKRV